MIDKAFSSIDFVGQCLVDEERTLAFQNAINSVVKKNDTVLDLGTGSGILALSASRAGAKKVCAVEFDPFVAQIVKRAIEVNNLGKKVHLSVKDACTYNLPRKCKIDVVVSEMLTTGMVDESQVEAMNNLHEKNYVDNSTVFLPSKQTTYVSLVNADFTVFGLKIPMILHLWKWHNWTKFKITKISDQIILNSIVFNKKNNLNFSAVVVLEAKKTGKINGLYLTSRTYLTENIFLDDTEALNAPMLIPISEKYLKSGQKIKLKIIYKFGGGYRNFRVSFV